MTSVFVYGSLKRGQSRSSLLDGQEFFGEKKTAPKYRLFRVKGSFPALVEASRPDVMLPGVSVEGELWQVEHACLMMLDRVEGVAHGLFERQKVELLDFDGEAEAYFWAGSMDGLEECGVMWGNGDLSAPSHPNDRLPVRGDL